MYCMESHSWLDLGCGEEDSTRGRRGGLGGTCVEAEAGSEGHWFGENEKGGCAGAGDRK
jgi:hypothetical protein